MEEVGKVIKIEGEYATVKVDKRSECKKCGMCVFPKNADSIELRATNGIGAKEGDDVNVITSERGKWLGILLVFGVPLLLIAVVFLIAFLNSWSEVMMPLIGIGAIIIWFILLGVIDKKLKKLNSFSSEITSVVQPSSDKPKTEPYEVKEEVKPQIPDSDSLHKGENDGNN